MSAASMSLVALASCSSSCEIRARRPSFCNRNLGDAARCILVYQLRLVAAYADTAVGFESGPHRLGIVEADPLPLASESREPRHSIFGLLGVRVVLGAFDANDLISRFRGCGRVGRARPRIGLFVAPGCRHFACTDLHVEVGDEIGFVDSPTLGAVIIDYLWLLSLWAIARAAAGLAGFLLVLRSILFLVLLFRAACRSEQVPRVNLQRVIRGCRFRVFKCQFFGFFG